MKKSKDIYYIAAAFIVSFAFFAFAYPYHLIRREQMTLFVYNLPYIFNTYSRSGCIARVVGDFVEQFYCFRLTGPVVVSMLLTATGVLSYRIARNFTGKKVSFAIALLIFIWSLLRETETRYITQYTIASTGYLLCIYIALHFKKKTTKIYALPLSLLIGAYLFGSPYHKYYGKLLGRPDFEYEKLIALDVETFRENWDKVLEISNKDLLYNEACYMQNLAAAMKGQLSERLLTHPQNYGSGLFLMVSDVTPFSNGMAGEVWYHLGNMTLADQSAMVSLQFSPKHTGARYIQRLAMINLISEEYGSAEKYLKMLGQTITYRKWAKSMTPDNQDMQTKEYLAHMRRNAVRNDTVSSSNNYRLLLKELIKANPENEMAKEYLLCYDLLTLNLDSFMKDYLPEKPDRRIYQEAALIWVNIKHNEGKLPEVDRSSYGISEETIDRLRKFSRFPENYKNTYWYYYTYAAD